MKLSILLVKCFLIVSLASNNDHVDCWRVSSEGAASIDYEEYIVEPEPKCIMNKNCFLPKCNCDSMQPPADLKRYRKDEIPQLVVITIDDDNLDMQSYKVYKKLFENLKNPNNQSIKGTFFLSDSNNATSFCLARNLYDQMHEISVSTVNYTCPHKLCNVAGPTFKPWKYATWIDQILNMRERLSMYAGIPKTDIIGFRAPLLEPSADMHYRIIMGNKFLYDSSLVVSSDGNQTIMPWPFTLDYKLNSIVSNNGPIDKYQGLWELPLPIYIGHDEKPLTCYKIWDSWCKIDRSVKGISKFLRSHFLRSYYNNRAPVVLHLNGNWLKEYVTVSYDDILPNIGFGDVRKRIVTHQRKEYRNLDGVLKFVNTTLTNNKDVYFVTARQAIQWIKLLPQLEKKHYNLKRYIDEKLLFSPNEEGEGEGEGEEEEEEEEEEGLGGWDGQCKMLNEKKKKRSKQHFDFLLDDSYGIGQKDGGQVKGRPPQLNKTILHDLQSEVLFVNQIVIYLIVGLGFVCIIIIIYDQFM